MVLAHTAYSNDNANNITLFVYVGPFLNCATSNVNVSMNELFDYTLLGSGIPTGLLVDNSSSLGVVSVQVQYCAHML